MLVVESRVSSNNKKKNENHDTQRYCRDSSKYVSAILFDYYFFIIPSCHIIFIYLIFFLIKNDQSMHIHYTLTVHYWLQLLNVDYYYTLLNI